jgi:hypothetical protein
VARITQLVVFEYLRMVVEMVGKIDVIVIPEGKRIEGAEFLGEIEHAVVFFDDAGFAGGGRNQSPVVVTLFGEYAEIVVDQQKCVFMDLRVKAGERFFEESPGTIVGWT